MKNYIKFEHRHYEYRCAEWDKDSKNEYRHFLLDLYCIFGEKEYNGEIYYLIDTEGYNGTNYFMVKKSEFTKNTDYELY